MPLSSSTAVAADLASFEALMRRHNSRLFRVARSILKDEAEAEDALQEAYVQAYRKIGGFRGEAEMGTWLTRIVINQALMQLRRRKREQVVVPLRGSDPDREAEEANVADPRAESPADVTLRGEVRKIIERRIDELPVAFRTVFVLREVEEMTVDETAVCLGIPAATVRTRLFRARALLREALDRDMDAAKAGVFAFAGARCDRIVTAVLARIHS
jgi:RNA polymerase sigma-70 factor (ECF subfamily)